MLSCLIAASQLHAHEAGLHDVEHACISCDLEDIVSHGAVTSSFHFAIVPETETDNAPVSFTRVCGDHYAYAIRAPPALS